MFHMLAMRSLLPDTQNEFRHKYQQFINASRQCSESPLHLNTQILREDELVETGRIKIETICCVKYVWLNISLFIYLYFKHIS